MERMNRHATVVLPRRRSHRAKPWRSSQVLSGAAVVRSVTPGTSRTAKWGENVSTFGKAVAAASGIDRRKAFRKACHTALTVRGVWGNPERNRDRLGPPRSPKAVLTTAMVAQCTVEPPQAPASGAMFQASC